jgi:hypothetical protein
MGGYLKCGSSPFFAADLGNKLEEWESSTFTEAPALPDDYRGWLKPGKGNQGGYNAIFIDKPGGRVRFVQITRGDYHSLKIDISTSFS